MAGQLKASSACVVSRRGKGKKKMRKKGDGVCRGPELIHLALARVFKMLAGAGASCSNSRSTSFCRRSLLICFLTTWLLVLVDRATADVNLVALVPAATEPAATSASDGYFPQANALASVMRLAAEHVNNDGTLLVGNVNISVETAALGGAASAAAGLCSSLLGGAASGGNSSPVAVSAASEWSV